MSEEVLTDNDIALLSGRGRLLGRMMKYAYVLLASVLLALVMKDVLVYREFALGNTKEVLWGGVLFGASLVAVHGILWMYERRLGRAVRADLAGGTKICKTGILQRVEESAENEPTRFQVAAFSNGEVEEFALSTISDLIRIKPTSLIGKRVEIEYAPITRIVLRLREASE